tara:strand:- start:4780 stop:5565 length:786 start_codon:yes stop_codon:yes gene_type:complete
MAGITLAAAGIGILGSVVGGMIGSRKAKDAAAAAKAERDRISREMAEFEANRQDVINPYSDVTSLSGMVDEMRDNLTNPFASLGVATQAAEIQMEQTDIALANTLDTLQATGASAGGATALAQAAKQSKKEVSANIEQQEAANEKLRAEGEQALQAKEMRLTEMEMSEEARIQNADAQGKAFVFGAQEQRDMATLDRMQSGIDQANTNAANANMAGAQAQAGMITGITSSVGGLMSSGAFSKGGSLNPYAGAINPATGLPF